MYDKLFQPFQIKSVKIRNRVCMPSMVCFHWADASGQVTERHIRHYQAAARGGVGLIIQEATCVSETGRLSGDQLGLWDDGQVPGLRRLVEAVHREGVPIFNQIHHAGVMGNGADLLCPSDFSCMGKKKMQHGREITPEEIRRVQAEFVAAARRSYEAGYDGVELHGCHSYLISQFLNRNVNRRTDGYGQKPETFVTEILEEIRRVTPPEFIVGIRLGAFEPALADGIAHARLLEAHGIDFFDVSYGFRGQDSPEKPADFPYKDVIYAAGEIKKQVSVPVFAVNSIKNGEMAEDILRRTSVDMVDIGRGILVNYHWANDVKEGRDPGKCLDCKECIWRLTPDRTVCPGYRQYMKRQTGETIG